MLASCTCCEDEASGCPAFGWMSLHRWKGSAVIPNDFKLIPGPDGGLSVWERAGLERYEDAVWQWRVVVLGTGDIPDLTELCLAQNRQDWSEWTAPISDRPHSVFYKLELAEVKYSDSVLTASLTGGTFTLILTVGSLVDSVTVNWNDSPATIQTALQGLSNVTNAGTIEVTGGPLASAHLAIAFRLPIDNVSLSLTTALIGTPPNVLVETLQDGNGVSIEEQQLLHYEWPAHAGNYTLTVTASGSTQTTGPIAFNAPATSIRNALLALSNLNTPPTVSAVVLNAGSGSGNARQQLAVGNGATITGGTYQLILTVNGTTQITSPIDWNANGSDVRDALLALPNVLATDDLTVLPNSFPFEVEFKGTLGLQYVAPMIVANALVGGDVSVTSTTSSSAAYNPQTHARHTIRFVGALLFVDVAAITAASSLLNQPKIRLTTPFASSVGAFRGNWQPLNVGTVWKHYIRKGWGNVDNRAMRRTLKEYTDNPFLPPVAGSRDIQEQPCGYGIWTPGGCQYRSNIDNNREQAGVRQTAFDFSTARAEFNEANGTINVIAELPWEFSLQVRCLGCHYSSEFNLWGIHESNTNRGHQIYDQLALEEFEPMSSGPCGADGGFYGIGLGNAPDLQECREWRYRESNVPYLFRKRNGPDGYDAHLVNDVFFSEGTSAARKPICSPGVVALGSGYYLEQYYSRGFLEYRCSEEAGALQGHSMLRSCPPRPDHEHEVEKPTLDVERLKDIYGTDFSWWGGWIDPESITLPKLRCLFDQFDLDGVRVLFLGGLPVGKVPQEDNRSGHDGRPGWTGSVLYPEPGDDFFGGSSQSWRTSVGKEFESGTLEPLKRWLNQGGHTLVLDGGCFPEKLFTELGLTSTIESQSVFGYSTPSPSPNTLNGSLFTQPIWGPELPDWYSENYLVPFFEALYVEPNGESHPFLNDVESGIDASGEPNIITDFTMGGTNIAGQPMNTGNVGRGLINVSQKYGYDGHLYNDYLKSAGTRSYTTCVPKVSPGVGAHVLGYVRGKLPIVTPGGLHPPIIGYTDINYPAMVVEHWAAEFRLRFTHSGSTYETGPLPFTATVTDIKNALEALPNIGTSITVLGSALPSSVDVYFDSPLVQGQNVATLVVLDSSAITVSVVREGATGVDEIQRLKIGRGPSRIVLSNVSELVNPEGWGTNWEGLPATGSNGTVYSQEQDDRVYLLTGGVISSCGKDHLDYYGKRGYNFGLGLSHIAAAKFLKNLWDYRDDY